MNKIPSLFAALLLATPPFLHAQSRVEPDTFFKPAPTAPDTLEENVLYPAGKMFPFSFFSLGGGPKDTARPEEEIQALFTRYKEAGFQMFGPQYELNERMLKDAEQHQLKAVYTIKYDVDFHGKEPVVIDSEAVHADLTQQVKAVADNSSIALWYLQPEELRPWRKNEMQFLEAASKAIHEADPKKRPIWIYDPAHAGAKRLASIAPWVDYLGKGTYTNYASKRDQRIWVRWSIEQELEAIKETKSNAIPLLVPEMYHDSRHPALTPEDIALIPQWVAHDNWLGLVSGAKGIVVFSLRQRPSLPPEAWEEYFKAYAELGGHLLGENALAEVLLFGEVREDMPVDITDGPTEVELVINENTLTYPSVSHRAIAYGADRYLFLVNSANEPVTVVVGGMPYASVKANNLLSDSPVFDVGEGEFTVELAPLEARAYHLSRK